MTTSSLSWTRAAVQSYPCTSTGFGSWEMIEETLGGRNPEGTLGSAALMSSPESVLLIICSLNALGHLGAGKSQFFPLTSLQRQSRAAAFPPGFLLSSFCLGSSTSWCCWRHLSCQRGVSPSLTSCHHEFWLFWLWPGHVQLFTHQSLWSGLLSIPSLGKS